MKIIFGQQELLSPFKRSLSPISPSTIIHETKFQKWLQTQEQRRLNITKTCEKYGAWIKYNIKRENLMYDRTHKLLFCRNAKVSYLIYIERLTKFPPALMGILAPMFAHMRHSLWPPFDTSRKLQRTCLQSHLQTSPQKRQKSNPKFCLFPPMGVFAPRLRTLDVSARSPIDTSGNFRRTCLQSHLQTSPPTPQKSYPKFRNPRTNFEIFNFFL